MYYLKIDIPILSRYEAAAGKFPISSVTRHPLTADFFLILYIQWFSALCLINSL